MSRNSVTLTFVLCSLFLASCGHEQTVSPLLPGSENPAAIQNLLLDPIQEANLDSIQDTVQDPVVGQPEAEHDVPMFRGSVEFANVLTVDLDPLLDAADLDRAYSGVMAQNGLSVLVPVKGESGHDEAYISIDTLSGEATWMFRDLTSDTRILFNTNNKPIAVLAIGCGSVGFTAEQDTALFDITSVVPEGRCISAEQTLSSTGDVMLMGSYAQGSGTPYSNTSTRYHAYTFNTASLVDYPDLQLQYDGVSLSPQWPESLFKRAGLSGDGSWLLTPQWWEGTGSFGDTHRQVGAVLWNTSTGDWKTLGLSADERNCIATRKVSCKPPYSYVISANGSTLYIQTPTSRQINQGVGPVIQFATITDKAHTNLPSTITVPGLNSGSSLTVDNSGRRLIFFATADTDSLTKGYTLYDDQTGQYVSLNRSLSDCAFNRDIVSSDDAECLYMSIPVSISSNATAFTADGSTLLLKSISRSTGSQQHAVDNFLVDIIDNNVYLIPEPFSGDSDYISGDGSVLFGVSGFPDYDFVIGRR